MATLTFSGQTPAVIPLSGHFISKSNGECEAVKISEELCPSFDRLQEVTLWRRKNRLEVTAEGVVSAHLTDPALLSFFIYWLLSVGTHGQHFSPV